MLDGMRLLLTNALIMCLLIPVAEHFGGRSLPPGVEWIFFWVGAIGLASVAALSGLLWLLRRFRFLGLRSSQ
jgi:hypothetical protein